MAKRSYVTNWAGNQVFAPQWIVHAGSEDQLESTVAAAAAEGQTVKAMGAGHSFTAIAATSGVHVTIDGLDRLFEVDHAARQVTVGAGITLRALNRELDRHGLALENLGDIDSQTLAGAISTGTHGTGLGFGGIATQVIGLRLVGPDGVSRDIDAESDPELFACARVGLGALGVISRVRLQCVDAFRLEVIEEPGPIQAALEAWPETIRRYDHAEFYWLPGTRTALSKLHMRTSADPEPLGRASRFRDKIIGENIAFGAICRAARMMPAAAPRLARLIASTPARRSYVDKSFRVFCTPRLVRFYETEWSIELDAVADAVREIDALTRRLSAPITFPVEVRCTAADDIALSTANGRVSGYIAAHVYRGTSYDEYFDGIAAIARAHGGRPHWGKLHSLSAAELAPRYPDWQRFQAARAAADPEGRFANPYLDRVLGPPAAP